MQIVNVATFELRSINKYQHYAIRCDTFYKVVGILYLHVQMVLYFKEIILEFFSALKGFPS